MHTCVCADDKEDEDTDVAVDELFEDTAEDIYKTLYIHHSTIMILSANEAPCFTGEAMLFLMAVDLSLEDALNLLLCRSVVTDASLVLSSDIGFRKLTLSYLTCVSSLFVPLLALFLACGDFAVAGLSSICCFTTYKLFFAHINFCHLVISLKYLFKNLFIRKRLVSSNFTSYKRIRYIS